MADNFIQSFFSFSSKTRHEKALRTKKEKKHFEDQNTLAYYSNAKLRAETVWSNGHQIFCVKTFILGGELELFS